MSARITFQPWQVRGEKRIISGERQWKNPVKLNRLAMDWPLQFTRPQVLVDVDVFEGWQGRVVDHRGHDVWVSTRGTRAWEADDGTPGFAFDRRSLLLCDVRARLFRLIDATPNLDWLLTTRYPENVRRMWVPYGPNAADGEMDEYRSNVWLGVSVSTQADADWLREPLMACRDLCAKAFVSAEPLLESIDFSRWLFVGADGGWEYEGSRSNLLDWLIVGGESGPNARPCNVAWLRSIVGQCRSAGVPVFVKQMGANVIDRNDAGFASEWNDGEGWSESVEVEEHIGGYRTDYQGAPVRVRTRDQKGGDPAEWPDDLRVREVPQ